MASPFSRTLRSLAADGSSRSWLVWGLAGALSAAWLTWFVAGTVTVFEVSRAARLEAVSAAHPVAALHGGALVRSSLVLGRPVRAGEVLVELDARSATLRLREEQQRLQSLPARRKALVAELQALQEASRHEQQAVQSAALVAEARMREAAAQLAFARDYERRLAEEVRGGGVAEVDLLRARADARRQAAQLDALGAEPQRLAADAQARAGQQRSRVEALQGQVAALDAEAALLATSVARLETEIDRLRVRAPVDGTLAELAALRPGAWVAEGQHVATVLPPGRLRVVAEFSPATALGRLKPGQVARVRLDGFSWAQHGSLTARVQQVAGEVRERQLRAELELDAAGVPPGLAPQHGLSGTVEVALEEVSPALLLLRSLGRSMAPALPVSTAVAATR
ncbi:MAG: HlyD family efflux transporter periplasmic adaptor subunit [Rubrivivax sp.]